MRNGMVVARRVCWVAVLVALAAGTGGCGLKKERERAKKTSSMANLKQISMACQMWTAEHGEGFPPSLEALVDGGQIADRSVLECPAKPGETGYDYVAGLSAADGSSLVLAYEKDGCFEGGRNVLVLNGDVQWMTEADFQEALKKTQEYVREK